MLFSRIAKNFSTNSKYQVVFLRHGQSQWNKDKKFSGWTDIRLTPTGIQQAIKAGKTLKQNGFGFDICFTSTLTRSIQTFNYAADELDCHYIPVVKSWRLNQRHYGALQGLKKLQVLEKFGKEQTEKWRKNFDHPPPNVDKNDERNPALDRRYNEVDPKLLPLAQSLKLTTQRVMPFWYDSIVPTIKSGKKTIVVAHRNSLRGIIKTLNNLSDHEIVQLTVPTGIPLVYQFDQHFKPIKQYYLAQPDQLQRQMNKTKKQLAKA